MLSVVDLARDSRFERIRIEDVVFDPRNATQIERRNPFKTTDSDSPDAARTLMHGIFVGEIQALEGAGRTCYDYDTGDGLHRTGMCDPIETAIILTRLVQRAKPKPS